MKKWSPILLVFFSTMISAKTGALFEITSSGTPANINLTLCLNGLGPVSCQNYTVTNETVSIRTVIPNRLYSAAGIKINTPGFTVDASSGCTPSSNGYCLFSVSNTAAATIMINGQTPPPPPLLQAPL